MRDKKDTLGIKLVHYSKLYNMDNSQLGVLLKYLLWNEDPEFIKENTPDYTMKKMLKAVNEIELEVQRLLEDDPVFEKVFVDLVQQVKRSRECWHNLRNIIDEKKTDKDGKENNNSSCYEYKNGKITLFGNSYNDELKRLGKDKKDFIDYLEHNAPAFGLDVNIPYQMSELLEEYKSSL